MSQWVYVSKAYPKTWFEYGYTRSTDGFVIGIKDL